MPATDPSSSNLSAARKLRGRGVALAPPNRFERLHIDWDDEGRENLRLQEQGGFEGGEGEAEVLSVPTAFFKDDTQSIVTRNTSPDIGFDFSLNPYRGCEHGCAYCYARPTHEYLGFNAGIDFESKIMVKPRAAELLEAFLARRQWQPSPLACSGVTDCYQPVERKLRITRACLEVLARCRHPVSIVTKNHLVTRDIDVLSRLAELGAAAVFLSITSLDSDLARFLEPRASAPRQRLQAVRELSAAGIPVGVMAAPIIPGLNDHELPALLQAAADHGACTASFTLLRLPYGVKEIFAHWLSTHFPDRQGKVLDRLRAMRGGKLNDANFGTRMRGEGPMADQLRKLFRVSARRAGLDRPLPRLSTAAFTPPGGRQLELF